MTQKGVQSVAADERMLMRSAVVQGLRVEYAASATGIGTPSPRLSWMLETFGADWTLDRYEVELVRDAEPTRRVVVDSPEQVFVPWPFEPLPSRARARVRVRVGAGEEWTAFSEPVSVEIGLLERRDWSAEFVSPQTIGGLDDGAPLVYTRFVASSTARVAFARLYATAHGLYQVRINGHTITEDVLAPGWTAYEHRLLYQTYDVTRLIEEGANTISALIGNGWFRGQLVSQGNRSSYGDRLALLAQLELTFSDGTTQLIGTDATWRARASSILFDDFYDGQRRDLRVSDAVGVSDAGTDAVDVLPWPTHRLVASPAPPVRVTEHIPPARILTTPIGATVVDFGQNLVGWVRVVVRESRAGAEVVIRHAEVLENGELGMRPLRSAKSTSSYVLSGTANEVLMPTFTFNGFRYAEISGVDGLELSDVEALVLGTDLVRTGWFECSDPRLNQLHRNVVWSMRGNFLSVPTDCPQRDERLGWTGDIEVFAPTAAYLYDTAGFLAGWLRDLAAEQKPDGAVPFVIPDVLRNEDPAAAAWGDAATVVPSVLFHAYADAGMLRRQYPSMRLWVDKVESLTSPNGLWDTGFQFGDWLDPTAPPDDPALAQADPAVVATAYLARSAALVAEAARVLGERADALHYDALAARVIEAFNRHYVSQDGRVSSECQTVYALTLHWNLILDQDARTQAGRRLVRLVRDADYRVSTGFVGTPLILDALCVAGEPALAYRMLVQTECPSWLYSVEMGATTMWERWDSMLPDGSVNPGEMTSFNHYAYGAVADWLHGVVAGVRAVEPGYRRVEIRPVIGAGLTSASTRHDCPYGTIASSWTVRDDVFRLEFSLPSGVKADVWLPGDTAARAFGTGVHVLSTRLEQ